MTTTAEVVALGVASIDWQQEGQPIGTVQRTAVETGQGVVVVVLLHCLMTMGVLRQRS
jgi:hypothetical protein